MTNKIYFAYHDNRRGPDILGILSKNEYKELKNDQTYSGYLFYKEYIIIEGDKEYDHVYKIFASYYRNALFIHYIKLYLKNDIIENYSYFSKKIEKGHFTHLLEMLNEHFNINEEYPERINIFIQ